MSSTKPRAGDLAAVTAEKLRKDKEEEIRANADRLSTAAAVEAEARLNEIVDATTPQPTTELIDDDEIVEFDVVDPETETVIMRVNEKLAQVTIGVGNHYDFEPGVQYKVTQHVYNHLNELGYVWH